MVTALITGRARAYVNFGKWVADCPIRCGGAMELAPGQTLFACEECKTISETEWPVNADEIWAALSRRVAPVNRNWYPRDHHVALMAGCPHGQSVKELDDETAEHEGR